MAELRWLSDARMRRISPYFPLSHGIPRVDDRRVISELFPDPQWASVRYATRISRTT